MSGRRSGPIRGGVLVSCGDVGLVSFFFPFLCYRGLLGLDYIVVSSRDQVSGGILFVPPGDGERSAD